MEKIAEKLSSRDLIPILNSITDAVFIDDADGNTLWCNDACVKLYKVDSKEIFGKNVRYLESTGVFNPSVARLVLEKKQEVTIVHENKDGKKLLSTGTPLFLSLIHI